MPLTPHLLAGLLLLSLSAPGAAAHITDQLVVGLYDEPKAEGTPRRLLSSGTPLEVLKRAGPFARVRLADDTEGWVEASYVTDEKPAKAILLETQARLRQMGIELAALRERQAAAGPGPDPAQPTLPNAAEAQLREALTRAGERIAELERQVVDQPQARELQAELAGLRASARQALVVLAEAQGMELHTASGPAQEGPVRRYLPWIAGVAMLVLGFAAGVAYIDYRIRKRYGGFRI